MTVIKKCRSRKHSFGGCGDPRCPEGLSIQKAMETALNNKDVLAYIEAKQLKDIKPNMYFTDRGLAALHITHNNGKDIDILRYIDRREAVQQHINTLDRTYIPEFNNISEIQTYINETYRPYASISLRQYDGYGPKENITRLSVAHMQVDADLRGAGIGSYFRKIILKHADKNGYIISGTPTNTGDGTMEHTDENTEDYRQHAINHRNRLIHFYERNGYERNYGTSPVVNGSDDYLTNKPLEQNPAWLAKFNEEGQALLYDAGSYIRWPNNKIPNELLR